MDLENQVQDQIARNILWNAEDQVDEDRSDMEVSREARALESSLRLASSPSHFADSPSSPSSLCSVLLPGCR